jgi:serine/threonine-protein kinase
MPAAAGGADLAPRIEKFGRYFLLDRIATGGMAEVYRAVTQGVEGFRRTFVVKRILSEKASSPAFIRMFCDEARICALLHHPNIVQVYDFGHVQGSYFLAMEYLPGKDLSSLMRVLRAAKASVPPALATFVAREAAVGLHYAHILRGANGQGLGIVHRDVTPSNIMLLFAGGVKLLDFGIAKAATATDREGEGVKGKLGYLAPEQARGEEVDGRADVYALGVTLWEMLVGRRLFAGKDDLETLRNVLQKPVPPPSSLRPGIPAELDRVVLRALERDREQRYATAEELARDCDAVLGTLRADSQTLRAFLNDLFAEESSSLSLEVPELPEELFADTPVAAPSDSAVPRNEESLRIEVIDASSPHGRTRTPAPPFGVIAAEDAEIAAFAGRAKGRRRAIAGGVALAAGVLIAFGVARAGRKPAVTAKVEVPAVTEPALAAPPAEAPREAPAPLVAAPAPAPPPAIPSAAGEASGTNAAPSPPADKSEHRHSHRRARELSADMTLNPF